MAIIARSPDELRVWVGRELGVSDGLTADPVRFPAPLLRLRRVSPVLAGGHPLVEGRWITESC
jgi:hypothetical protein